jgi:phosphoserine phosphatase
MNDLVLQGPGLDDAAVADWQARAGATGRHSLAPAVWRLTAFNPASGIVAAAQAAGLDAFALDRVRHRTDFRLLAMDMDSTLITIECIDELADFAGVKAEVSAVTEAAMRGELDFPGALRRRVALLKGLPESVFARVYEERLRLSPGAEPWLEFARAAGWTTLLVSGGFTYFTGRLQERLGLHHTLANTLEFEGGMLTGRVTGDIVDAAVKAARVRSACEALGCTVAQAVVIGDGANDLKMMAGAGLSVAFHAKPVVRAQAHVAVTRGGLDTLRWCFEDGLTSQ